MVYLWNLDSRVQDLSHHSFEYLYTVLFFGENFFFDCSEEDR